MTNLYEANRNWRERPADQRYRTLSEMYNEAYRRHLASVVSNISLQELNIGLSQENNEIRIAGQSFQAEFTHWSFDQLGRFLGLPIEWLRTAPPQLVADSVRFGISQATRERLNMLWYIPEVTGATGLIRSVTTSTYKHLWDDDLLQMLMELSHNEVDWKCPPAATDRQYPSGYYMSDRDLWVFLVSQNDIANGELKRGFFLWNTEVQGGWLQSFGMRAFYYQSVCGNHIVWGNQNLFDLRMIHTGSNIYNRVRHNVLDAVAKYLHRSSAEDKCVVDSARKFSIGKRSDEAITWARNRGLTQLAAQEALAASVERGDNPFTLWSMVVSLTTLSQRARWAGDRARLDFQAGKLLQEVSA